MYGLHRRQNATNQWNLYRVDAENIHSPQRRTTEIPRRKLFQKEAISEGVGGGGGGFQKGGMCGGGGGGGGGDYL